MEQTASEKSSPSNLTPSEFTAMGKKRLEDLIKMQMELFEKLQEMNRNWIERMQSEAALASEFATKLTAARSIPETATVCQDWAKRRMEMSAEDAKRLVADGQKVLQTGTHMMTNGWLSNGGSGST